MKKSTLIALLGGCTLAFTTQAALAFYDPNLTPSGHPAASQEKAAQTSQLSDALSYLNKSGYSVRNLTLLPDGNYSAQVAGPDAKIKNVQVLVKQREILDDNGQKLMPLLQADEAVAWLKQMGYTPQTFQVSDGKYVFTANDKNGIAENVTIDPATKNLSVVEASNQAKTQELAAAQ